MSLVIIILVDILLPDVLAQGVFIPIAIDWAVDVGIALPESPTPCHRVSLRNRITFRIDISFAAVFIVETFVVVLA